MPKPQLGSTSKNSVNCCGPIFIAAADIGSNAVRMLLAEASYEDEVPQFSKEQAMRLPIRIGADVFSPKDVKKVKKETCKKLVAAMTIFRALSDIYQPQALRVCATSALREADNYDSIVERIQDACGIKIEVIDAETEAKLIYRTLETAKNRPPTERTLHIDLGGGSTELIYGSKKKIMEFASFHIGTVRRQHEDCTDAESKMHGWLRQTVGNCLRYSITATGGNAKYIYKMCDERKYVKLSELKKIQKEVSALSVEQRIRQLNMRPDRADTIIHATEIYIGILQLTGHNKLYLPSTDLVRGIVHNLATELHCKQLAAANEAAMVAAKS